MKDSKLPGYWTVIAASVRGASHRRAGTVNQDSFRIIPNRSRKPLVVMALSDGHGGAKYFRSHRGSEIATRVACRTLYHFFGRFPLAGQSQRLLETTGGHLIIRQMVRQWRDRVFEDVSRSPFQPEELDRLATLENPAACDRIRQHPVIAYGATLLAVVAAGDYLAWWQLGDGDILQVSEQGQVSRPFPVDQRFLADETTSLVTPRAWQEFRYQFQSIHTVPPPLFLLATDGYANSFRDESNFYQVGPDFLNLLRTQGAGFIQNHLPQWLKESTDLGSGDDITVGLLCHPKTSPPQTSRREQQ